MKPGMRALLMDRARQGNDQNRSEYGGNTNRRMIGYGRAEPDMNYGRLPMRHIPPNSNDHWPATDGERWPPVGNERYMPHRNAYDGLHEPPRSGWDNPHMADYNAMPEGRRRRDKRGRYMLGGMEYDEDDDEDDRPRSMRPHGNSYGDIYAEGTIYAPGAMNRPMSGMMAGTMSGDMTAPVDEHTARMWVGKMDGGEHYRIDQSEQLRNAICPDCEKWEFFVAMNAMYSDHCETAKKFGTDKPEYYAHLARDFLKDKDAGPHKLRKYMEMIPKK